MRRKRLKTKPLFRCFLYLFVFIIFIIYCEKQVELLPKEYLVQVSKSYADKVINKTVLDEFEDFKNTYSATRTDENKISYIELNATDLSVFKAKLADNLAENLTSTNFEFIPIGSLMNMRFLNGIGFTIPISMSYSGFAFVEIQTKLLEAGINQTVYQISAIVTANVINISVSTNVIETQITTSYPLGEFYISGEIPNYRMNIS